MQTGPGIKNSPPLPILKAFNLPTWDVLGHRLTLERI